MSRDIWEKEEARAERLSNLIRFIYVLFWLASTVFSYTTQPHWANVANIGLGALWLLTAVILYAYLRVQPYKPFIKYLSTTSDILIITGVLFMYHYDMGYSTTLKSIPFLNYFFVLVLATLRFNVFLPIYGGLLSLAAYFVMFSFGSASGHIVFGSMMEEFSTPKINLVQQIYRGTYLIVFTILLLILVRNMHRLIRIRAEETERAFNEKIKRERTQFLFDRYFTPQMANYLAENPLELGGRSQRVTVMMCDLRNFTALCEKMGATKTVNLLNMLFESLIDIILKHGGHLDKFLGDGMLIVFGVPHSQHDDATRAVDAAVEMVQKVRESGLSHELEMGIAINTGDVISGNIGSHRRMEFTVIGDAVNTVSRMEALNKEFGTSIILSESTLKELTKTVPLYELPETQLRGKSVPMKLYAVKDIYKGFTTFVPAGFKEYSPTR